MLAVQRVRTSSRPIALMREEKKFSSVHVTPSSTSQFVLPRSPRPARPSSHETLQGCFNSTSARNTGSYFATPTRNQSKNPLRHEVVASAVLGMVARARQVGTSSCAELRLVLSMRCTICPSASGALSSITRASYFLPRLATARWSVRSSSTSQVTMSGGSRAPTPAHVHRASVALTVTSRPAWSRAWLRQGVPALPQRTTTARSLPESRPMLSSMTTSTRSAMSITSAATLAVSSAAASSAAAPTVASVAAASAASAASAPSAAPAASAASTKLESYGPSSGLAARSAGPTPAPLRTDCTV
mmetsp:Transcript_67158/g.111672  ORF Transcript_67158/g.111672 Transcript_67158/m.111672 type:complete len:302 (+) Transcript_67158:791-1696(+)